MTPEEFRRKEWEAMVAALGPEFPAIAREAKSLFKCPGALVLWGERKPEPEEPKYVEPFRAD